MSKDLTSLISPVEFDLGILTKVLLEPNFRNKHPIGMAFMQQIKSYGLSLGDLANIILRNY